MTDKQIIERLKTDLDFERTKRKTLQAELQTKEQECERLEIYIESNEQQVKEVEKLVMDNDRLINELENYKQALENVREMCISVKDVENVNSLYDAKQSGMYLQAIKILQKIKEVEND